MFTAGELARMRTTADTALPDSCVIQSQAWNSDGGGGGTTAWTTSGTVDCRVAPVGGMGAGEDNYGGRISAEAEFVITLPQDAAVSTNSRIIHSGGTFNVEAIRDRSYEVTQRVEAKREAS
jgi:head-tail adaptor